MKQFRKNAVRVLALILAALMVLGVILSAVYALAEEIPESGRTQYTLSLRVHEGAQAVEVTQTTRCQNDTGKPINYLLFNLYANAYRRSDTAPVADGAYPAGFAPGGVDFVSVKVNGETADWGVRGEREQFLRVACELAPGESAEFAFDYYVLLPECAGAFGVYGGEWHLTGFFPSVAAYSDTLEDFVQEPYTGIGECFVQESADFEVTLELPEGCGFACAGTRERVKTENGSEIWQIRAVDTRDFALFLSAGWTAREADADGLTLRAYSTNAKTAEQALTYAREMLATYAAWFGDLPYDALSIVFSEAYDGGIAYPGVILLGDELSGAALETELARQVAEQYFACLVGTNPGKEPWLDEAVSAYAALLYFEEKNGYEDFLKRLNEQVLDALQVTLPGGLYVDAAANRFASVDEYETVVRDRGCAVLHELRCAMGREPLIEALGVYVKEMSGKIASIADFTRALDASGGRWDEFLVGQMYSIGDYAQQTLEWYE